MVPKAARDAGESGGIAGASWAEGGNRPLVFLFFFFFWGGGGVVLKIAVPKMAGFLLVSL